MIKFNELTKLGIDQMQAADYLNLAANDWDKFQEVVMTAQAAVVINNDEEERIHNNIIHNLAVSLNAVLQSLPPIHEDYEYLAKIAEEQAQRLFYIQRKLMTGSTDK